GARATAESGLVDLEPSPGRVDLAIGSIALKTLKVVVVPQHLVNLGGQSIGVVARVQGTGVVGYGYFPTVSGGRVSPAIQAGLRVGDRLTAVDGQPIRDAQDLLGRVQSAGRAGRTVQLTVRRHGRRMEVAARPQMDRQLGTYRLGVYLRERMVGVGTLTFSDPATGAFAALGHAVDASLGPVQWRDP
ncbi:stage IV sporulation protein B, partial [mine drainage metagenome]